MKVSAAREHKNRGAIQLLGRLLRPDLEWETSREGQATVKAVVAGEAVVRHHILRVRADHPEHGYAKVHVFWEDTGIEDYQERGLPGSFPASFNSFKWDGPSLIIDGSWPERKGSYSVRISPEPFPRK